MAECDTRFYLYHPDKLSGFDSFATPKDEVISKMLPVSLYEQGLMKPQTNGAKFLTINGEKDILADRLMDEIGIEQDTLIFENDGHVAPAHYDIHASNFRRYQLGFRFQAE